MADDKSSRGKGTPVFIPKINTTVISGVTIPTVTAAVNYVTSVSLHGKSVQLNGQTINRIGDI